MVHQIFFCLQTVADQAYAGGFPVSGPAAAHLRVGPEVQQAAHHQADREHGAPRQGEQSRVVITLSAAYRVFTFLPILALRDLNG